MNDKILAEMLQTDPEYKKRGLEGLKKLVGEGKALVEKHGEDNLHNLLDAEQMRAAGAFFEYRVFSELEETGDEDEEL